MIEFNEEEFKDYKKIYEDEYHIVFQNDHQKVTIVECGARITTRIDKYEN